LLRKRGSRPRKTKIRKNLKGARGIGKLIKVVKGFPGKLVKGFPGKLGKLIKVVRRFPGKLVKGFLGKLVRKTN